MEKVKKILLVTTTNLFSNPRLVKELDLYYSLNYNVTVISFLIGNGDGQSEEIENKYPKTRFIHLSALRTSYLSWLYASITNKFYLLIWPLFKRNLLVTAYASNKRSKQIVRLLKKEKKEYNIIVSHTLGALFPAYTFSKKKEIPFAFDMEDYHPGELIKEDIQNEKTRRETLLKKILPKAYYTSFASPLFKTQTLSLTKDLPKQTFTTLNSFPENEFHLNQNSSEKIILIWYSLTIDKGRGLEKILPVIDKFSKKIQLKLVGQLNEDFDKEYNILNSNYIDYLGYLSQNDLHNSLCKADIGLALEQNDTDLNRSLCLTNKIISYCQAGLYIFASDTVAQSKLLEENPDMGLISSNFNEDLSVVINEIDNIRNQKEKRYSEGTNFSWEQQQKLYIDVLKNV